MSIKTVKNLRWDDASNTALAADVEFENVSYEIPMVVTEDYDTLAGRFLYEQAVAGDFGPIAPYSAPKKPSIAERREAAPIISAAAIRLGLIQAGVTMQQVQSVIDGISDPVEKDTVQVLWDFGTQFKRTDERLVKHLTALGLSTTDADKIWGIE